MAKIYKKFSDQLTKILKEQSRTQERDDKLHNLNISFRNEIELKRVEFYEKLVKNMICDLFAALYEPHMSFNPNDSSR